MPTITEPGLSQELERLTTAQLERAYWGRWLVMERSLQWVAGWLPGWNRWAKRGLVRREHPYAYRLALQSALAADIGDKWEGAPGSHGA